MAHYGHPCPKRHKAFCNNVWAQRYNLGRLDVRKFVAKQKQEDKPTRKYVDKAGRKRFAGVGAALKKTQTFSCIGFMLIALLLQNISFNKCSNWSLGPRVYPAGFGAATRQLLPKLKSCAEGKPMWTLDFDGPMVFSNMMCSSEINWQEARLKPVLIYLRGNKSLRMPDAWKAVFPTHIV